MIVNLKRSFKAAEATTDIRENELQRVSRPNAMRRKIWLVPLAMLAAGAGYAYWLVWEGEEQYRKALATAKNEGLIATAEELAGVRATSTENSAGFYETAIRKLASMSRDERNLVSGYARASYQRDDWFKSHGYYAKPKHVDAVCLRYQDVIDTLRVASRRPRYDYLTNYGQFSIGLPFGRLLQFLKADAERCARTSNLDGAFERVALLRQLARHLVQEPLSLSCDSAGATEQAAAKTTLSVAWILRDNAEATNRLRHSLAQPVAVPNLLNLQRVMLLQNLEELKLVVSNPQALGLSESDMWNGNIMFARLPQVQPRLKAAAIRRARREIPLLKLSSIEEICVKQAKQPDPEDEFEYRASFLHNDSVARPIRQLASAEATRKLALGMASVIDAWRIHRKFPKELPGEFRLLLSAEARKMLGIELDDYHLAATIQDAFSARLQLPPDYEKPEKKGPRTRE